MGQMPGWWHGGWNGSRGLPRTLVLPARDLPTHPQPLSQTWDCPVLLSMTWIEAHGALWISWEGRPLSGQQAVTGRGRGHLGMAWE